jgi:tetratricopeptide (TPR) repeat protein
MKNVWLDSRKDIFLRELVGDFFEAKSYFDALYAHYHKVSTVSFNQVDAWIGTEIKKGPLWNLRDQCHRLFRNSGLSNNLFEHLFDWTIGSVFYEAIKVREDAYQLESYKPLLEHEAHRGNKALSKIIDEYFSVIENVQSTIKIELNRIHELFSKAIFHLKEILPLYKDNIFVVRLFLDNQNKLPERTFGKESCTQILTRMFPDGLHYAYLSVAEHCIKSGWHEDAVRYLKKALRIDKANPRARSLLEQLEQQQSIHHEEDHTV